MSHPATPSYVSRVSVAEFSAGFDSDAHAQKHLAPFAVLPVDERVWDTAAEIFRELRRAGFRIGLPDTLIAATALDYGLPVDTDNTEHFRRVRGLKIHAF